MFDKQSNRLLWHSDWMIKTDIRWTTQQKKKKTKITTKNRNYSKQSYRFEIIRYLEIVFICCCFPFFRWKKTQKIEKHLFVNLIKLSVYELCYAHADTHAHYECCAQQTKWHHIHTVGHRTRLHIQLYI